MTPTEIMTLFDATATQLQRATWISTDGAQSEHGTGAAIFLDNIPLISYSLRLPATVIGAELTAILLAVRQIRTQQRGTYVIASDSRSVLRALENHELKTKWRL